MWRAIIFGVLLLGIAGNASAQTQSSPQLANPASTRCAEQDGTLKIEKRPDGGQYGVCTFVDNYQCEEWALFRGECPKGGLRVTGYVTPAGRFCAITGGRYAVSSPPTAAVEKGVCSLPGGKTCDADAYYAGTCSR